MPLKAVTVYHVTLTAKVTIQETDAEEALRKAKKAIAAGVADFSWDNQKETIYVSGEAA